MEPDRRVLLGASELRQSVGGACRFFDRATRLCAVHRDHGEAMMPASCQHFPRRALIDDRGVFVTLSHFCSTATDMLFDTSSPLAVVESPPAFPADRLWDGLDARGHWPPLVCPDVLFELDRYSAFERYAVDTLARADSVHAATIAIGTTVERLRAWNHRRGPFAAWVDDALATTDRPGDATTFTRYEALRPLEVYDDVVGLVPPQHRAERLDEAAYTNARHFVDEQWMHFAPALRRYLAGKVFGAWTAYQGRGLRTLVAEVVVSETVVRAEAARLCAAAHRPLDRALFTKAIRAADWLLVHLLDRQAFVDWLGDVEQR